MDYSSVDSNFIESLNLLRPPIILRPQKVSKGINTGTFLPHLRHNINRFGKHSSKEINNSHGKNSDITPAPIHKSRIKQLHTQTLGRPVIKVTIIPKTVQYLASIVPRKRKNKFETGSKRLQASVPNHENISFTKNVLLIDKGRNKEQIYNLKATGSVEFDKQVNQVTNKNDDLDQHSSLKLVLDSFNMNKKKYIKKKKKLSDLPIDKNKQFRECFCLSPLSGEISPPPSRVRITGQLGLNETSEYVLQCNATVNRQPAQAVENKKCWDEVCMSDYNTTLTPARSENLLSHNIYPVMTCCNCVAYPRNSCQHVKTTQAHNNQAQKKNSQVKDSTAPSRQCKCVQVNMDIGFARTHELEDTVLNNEVTENRKTASEPIDKSLKRNQSPCIIITVYTQPEQGKENVEIITENLDSNKINIHSDLDSYQNFRMREINEPSLRDRQKKKLMANKEENITPLLRSRSPTNKGKSKTTEVRTITTNSRRSSPNRENSKQTTNRVNIKPKQDPTIGKPNLNKNKNVIDKNKTHPREEKATNTDHTIKRMLVDTYTEKIAAFLDNKRDERVLRTHPSSVTVDIDSDQEKYKFCIQHGCRTTDLNVRRTIKEKRETNKSDQENSKGDETLSLNNMFISDLDERTPGRIFRNQTIREIPPLQITPSGLKLRDSVELRRRREVKNCHNNAMCQTPKNNNDKMIAQIIQVPAPIKHHRGDNCKLYPMKRGKEINQIIATSRLSPSSQVIPGNNISILQLKNLCGGKGDHKTDMQEAVRQNSCEKYTRKPTIHTTSMLCSKYNNAMLEYNIIPNSNTSSTPFASNHILTKTTRNQKNAATGASLFQKVILNRNVQIFLQVHTLSKQKPIVLSRKQYNKVKKTVEHTISLDASRRGKSIYKTSFISVGEVRMKVQKKKQPQLHNEHADVAISCTPIKENRSVCCSQQCLVSLDKEEQRDPSRMSLSSLELRHAKTHSVLKQLLTFPPTKVEAGSNFRSDLTEKVRKSTHSLETLFKGRKRSVTPNLGTSLCSLDSENVKESQKTSNSKSDSEPREKKPFLRRLMSCLVLRSQAYKPKCAEPAAKMLSANSSFDSYYINTSLGAMEVSSSIYDTSASFYSNHSIHLVTSKVKRGFISSMREFLSNRKT